MDRLTRMKLKELESFVVLWKKFHELARTNEKSRLITPQKESEFLQTKEIISRRYKALLKILKKNMEPDPIAEILSESRISSLADKDQARRQANWVSADLMLNDWRKELQNAPAARGLLGRWFGKGK